jgi:hypothetical protein
MHHEAKQAFSLSQKGFVTQGDQRDEKGHTQASSMGVRVVDAI